MASGASLLTSQAARAVDLIVEAPEWLGGPTYGAFIFCGGPVPDERLDARPRVSTSVACTTSSRSYSAKVVPREGNRSQLGVEAGAPPWVGRSSLVQRSAEHEGDDHADGGEEDREPDQ